MINSGAKFYLGCGFLFLLAASLYAWSSGAFDQEAASGLADFDDRFTENIASILGSVIGALTLGYKGGVGDHVGYVVLVAASAIGLTLGVLMVVFRDGDAEAAATVAGTAVAPAPVVVSRPNIWAPIGGFGAGLVAVGLVAGRLFFFAGLVVLALVAIAWLMDAWTDQLSSDVGASGAMRDGVMGPFEVPILSVLLLGFVVFGVSRVLLTTSKMGSIIAAGVIATVILLVAVALSFKPKLGTGLVAGVLALGAVFVLAGAVVGIARGEREIKHHGDHSGEHSDDHSDEGDHSEEGAFVIVVPS